MAPLGPRRARQIRVEIDEHGTGDVAGVVVGAARGTAQPPPHVEHHGRFALRQQRGEPLCCDDRGGGGERGRAHADILPALARLHRRSRRIDWGLDEGAARVNELIDTTEMYLRTIYELEEEGVVPLRARIAERLAQSGPTVSQTVARMERDGLVVVAGDRHLELTEDGPQQAPSRSCASTGWPSCLLTQVIGLEWEHVHAEACRWEHVMSDAVERKLFAVARRALTISPYGNPIPGLEALAHPTADPPGRPARATPVRGRPGQRLDEFARARRRHRRAGPPDRRARAAQRADLMAELKSAGVLPGQ